MTNRSSTASPGRASGEPAAASSPLKRRGVLLGAAGVATAAGAAALASRGVPVATEVAAAKAVPGVRPAVGYQVTAHVLRYYETTKV